MPRCSFFFACVLATLSVTEVAAQKLVSRSPIQGSPLEVAAPTARAVRPGPRAGAEGLPTHNPLNSTPFENLTTVQRAAGTIFRGTVVSVQALKATRSGEMETVQVTFRIDDAFRGVRNGQSFTIREWSGLWLAGERYRVGEQVVLFLYPPSKLGLTSPVGGRFGRLEVDQQETVSLRQPSGRRFPARPLEREPEEPRSPRVRYRDLVRAIRGAEE